MPETPAPQPQPQHANSGVSLAGVAIVSLLTSTVAAVFAACLMAFLFSGGFQPPTDSVTPDPKFIPIGKEFAKLLGPNYAPSWKLLGESVANAKGTMKDLTEGFNADWTKRRTELFQAKIQPQLEAIIPDGTPDEKITTSQRQAFRAACYGLARGLDGK